MPRSASKDSHSRVRLLQTESETVEVPVCSSSSGEEAAPHSLTGRAGRIAKPLFLTLGLLVAAGAFLLVGLGDPQRSKANSVTPSVEFTNRKAMELVAVKGVKAGSGDEAEEAPSKKPPPASLSGEEHGETSTALSKEKTKEKVEEKKCSWVKTSCNETQCCNEAGMQCYQQGSSYAMCRPSCTPGPDPMHWDGGSWSCKELGRRTPGEVPECTAHGADCSKSRCCDTPGLQCYEKQVGWATCKATCTEGMDLTDSNADPWTCKKLGDTADGAASWVEAQCAAPGGDCRKAQCCAVKGQQCYQRDEFWAQCQEECDSGSWSCKTIGLRTPVDPLHQAADEGAVADWVAEKCTKTGKDCRKSKCCVGAGMQCFEKDNDTAVCKAVCNPGADLFDEDEKPWTCRALGPRTPGVVEHAPPKEVSAWVAKKCAKGTDGCLEVGCCAEVGMQCYTKTDGWATCLGDCEAGKNRSAYGDIDDKPWACKKHGMRTPRPWGKPSLYCISVVRVDGTEPDLMRAQIGKSAGIFACDDYDVFTSKQYQGRGTTWWHPDDEEQVEQPLVSIYLGVGPLGRLDTIPFRSTYVGTSLDHTAGNTELFLRVWAKVKERAHWQYADWTLKVDPDAVLIPSRMRKALEPHTGQNTYIVNCDKPGMAPMMFGSVEMLSKGALQTFFDKEEDCKGGLEWKVWGEDYFLGKCFDMIGVTRTEQFTAVSDGVCKGVDCGNGEAAAFHPMKDLTSWMSCWAQIEGDKK